MTFVLVGLALAGVGSAAAAPVEELVVEGFLESGGGAIDPITLRRLLAWRKGDLTIPRGSCCEISLDVKKIVKGDRHHDYVTRPSGTRMLPVVAIGEVALAVQQRRGAARGTWKLTVLPCGTLVVGDLANTPIKTNVREHVAKLTEAKADLLSGVPQRQYDAIRLLQDYRCFGLVSDILPLLDSEAKVTVPDGMRERLVTGECRPVPVASKLGVEARRHLARATHYLADRTSPTERDSAKAWRAWWGELLATDPFPDVKVADGPLRQVAQLPMHWPDMWISPDGDSALLTVNRVYKPTDTVRNGIRFVPLAGAGTARYVYEAPAKEINRLPSGTAAAWTGRAAGMVWHEYAHDEKHHKVYFLSVDRKGRPTGKVAALNLPKAHHLAVCPLPDGGWLAACNTRKGQQLLTQRVDAAGRPIAKAHVAMAGIGTDLEWHTGVHAMSMVATPGGAAVAIGGDEKAILVFLDGQGRFRKQVRVDDEKIRGHGYRPRLQADAKGLCVAWEQLDNHDDRLFVRLFDFDGRPRTPATVVEDFVQHIARPAAACQGRGFVLTWRSYAQTAYQVRAVRVDVKGKLGEIVTIYNGQRASPHVAAGISNGRLRALIYDWSRWPFRMLLKETDAP